MQRNGPPRPRCCTAPRRRPRPTPPPRCPVSLRDETRQVAKHAAAVVKELHNPFSLHNLTQWTLDHGPTILAIILAVGTFVRLSRILESRFVSLIANRGRFGNREERENRAKTLLG